MKVQFISSFRGCSDYRVSGQQVRCSVRYLAAEKQALLEPVDPQLVGIVVSGSQPVDQEVIDDFQGWLDELVSSLPELRDHYVRQLTTAKWYPDLGWIRCEPESVD